MKTGRIFLLLLTPLAACGGEAVRDDVGPVDSEVSRSGMPGMMHTAMMDSMAAHMRMMDTASAATMESMLPMHRQMAADMLTRMNDERQSMNMPADARWEALTDSLRRDLDQLSETGAAERAALLSAHRDRMSRLMEAHRDMMRSHQ